ncbi:MAG: FMN-binding protein [Lachnospiraceae bacterium]|nr:FMN-binding protein [Lachnospiraceae bacterium]
MKRMRVLLCAVLLMTVSVACGGGPASYRDGTYTARSSVYENDDGTDDGNGYGEVTITIVGGKITACTFETFEPDGTRKDEDYGKVNGEIANQDFFNKAQKATSACEEYARMLLESGTLNGVDTISGATINYNAFLEATEEALRQAAQ